MQCEFSRTMGRNEYAFKINDQDIPHTSQFRYLGSTTHEDSEIEEDVAHRIKM